VLVGRHHGAGAKQHQRFLADGLEPVIAPGRQKDAVVARQIPFFAAWPVETGAAVHNYENQIADAFALYESLGVNAVKTGYVGWGQGIKQRNESGRISGLEWHHGLGRRSRQLQRLGDPSFQPNALSGPGGVSPTAR